MKSLSIILVQFVEWVKLNTPLKRTWHSESLFVLLVLIITAIISGKGWIEWIGVAAVFFTFKHASIAERLTEAENKRFKKGDTIMVDCYYKLPIYFYIKEILWFSYFIIMGAWSAVIGVFVFLLYPVWRKTWKKYHN